MLRLFSLNAVYLSFKTLLEAVWTSYPPLVKKSPGEPLKRQGLEVSLLFPVELHRSTDKSALEGIILSAEKIASDHLENE